MEFRLLLVSLLLILIACKKKVQTEANPYFFNLKVNGMEYKGFPFGSAGAIETGCLAGKQYTSQKVGSSPIAPPTPPVSISFYLKLFYYNRDFNANDIGFKQIVDRIDEACANDAVLFVNGYYRDVNQPQFNRITNIEFKEDLPRFKIYVFRGDFKVAFRNSTQRHFLEGSYCVPVYISK